MIDVTGSKTDYIKAAKDEVLNISNSLNEKFSILILILDLVIFSLHVYPQFINMSLLSF